MSGQNDYRRPFVMPALPGVQPPDPERLALHYRIADYAAERGIDYADVAIILELQSRQ